MRRVKTSAGRLGATVLSGAIWAVTGLGLWADVTPAELSAGLARGEKITVIDIRSSARFQQGHIPEAINIPASLLAERKLPPLGRVVVCGSGLGLDVPETAVECLNAKPGIQAEVLLGGLAAWESAGGSSTRKKGFAAEELAYITVATLKERQNPDMILVDLRRRETTAEGRLQPLSVSGEPRTDLHQTFPRVGGVARSPFDLPLQPQSATASQGAPPKRVPPPRDDPQSRGVPPLLVLIDDGDGVVAQDMARTLQAGGVRRVVILVGGEQALSRQGKPGLQRWGGAVATPTLEE